MTGFAYRMVTCSNCGESYMCTPERDYFHVAGDPREPTAVNGVCWACLLAGHGMPEQPEPSYK